MAERAAFKYAQENGLDVITVCPSLTLGPLLQSDVNFSSLVLLSFLKGSQELIETYNCKYFVDVRDVAEALLLVYTKPDASGRYICSLNRIKFADLVDMVRNVYPSFNYPNNIPERNEGNDLSSEKLKKLGWKCRTLKETIADSIKYYQEVGLLTMEEKTT
ncbi:tetraketide alpha-pyrone reductase 1-like [Dendrobium catenatum]|uniref:tetraketide alpha-pyrone reductase 1-like n=1 Tax=Dendrobium catenatum TaxID=906689 RepID=UPI0009F5AA7D|nr:tetraketide alpha-pyrone reductase 1-like [Dendrobium catenatum]